MLNVISKIKVFIRKIDVVFILFIFSLIALLFLAKMLPAVFIATLALFLIIGSALYWGLPGGIVSAILATFINIVSFYATKHAIIHNLIVGSIAYFAIGILLGRFINLIRSQRAKLQESVSRYRNLFEKANDAIFIVDSKGKIQDCNPAACKLLGYTRDELLTKHLTDIITPENLTEKPLNLNRALNGESITVERNFKAKEGREITVEVNVSKLDSYLLLGIAHDITKIKEAEKQKLKRLHFLEILYSATQKFSESLNSEEVAYEVTRTCVEDLGASLAWIGRAEVDGSVTVLYQYPNDHPYPKNIKVRWDDTTEGQGPTEIAIRTGIPQIIKDISNHPGFGLRRAKATFESGFTTSAAFPLTTRGRTFGALNIYSDKRGFFDFEKVQLFQTFAHQAAAALENANLYEKSTRRLQHIQALRKIDMAINGSIDPRVTSTVALQETIRELNVDAAAIFRLNSYTQKLEFIAGYGFYTNMIEEISLSSKKSFAGRAVLERKTIYIPDIEREDEDIPKDLFRVEGFKAYYAVPLIAKGRVLGVLEVFMRNPRNVNNEWREFLETLAGQVAIAIDNAELFNNLQRSNVELLKAYDETIEALSYALDLKDKETEGHSQRVTELTLRIAKEMGIPEEQLIHIKRGALLHDIGKMGIPDSILLKPGKLSDEEWAIMKMHPVYAYQMLSQIEYLRPALDIPYCHHEKWDGSGYPRGLKGKEIPLAARIFAIVDVFDALSNDRPYRKAWPIEKVLEYIREQSGKHFDPQIVEVFIRLVKEKSISE